MWTKNDILKNIRKCNFLIFASLFLAGAVQLIGAETNFSPSPNFFSVKLVSNFLPYLSPHGSEYHPCSYSLWLFLFSFRSSNLNDRCSYLFDNPFRRSECSSNEWFPWPQIFWDSFFSAHIDLFAWSGKNQMAIWNCWL